jgi:hypothetical protein
VTEIFSRLRASLTTETIAELELKPDEADLLREHQAPLESCRCGIHAANDLKTLRLISGPGPVVGEVYLWGKVIPGELGLPGSVCISQEPAFGLQRRSR